MPLKTSDDGIKTWQQINLKSYLVDAGTNQLIGIRSLFPQNRIVFLQQVHLSPLFLIKGALAV